MYLHGMDKKDLDNELATAISSLEDAYWAYNYICSHCGKFQYPEECTKACKKCGSEYKNKKPLPFQSSPTALIKAIDWLKLKYPNNTKEVTTYFGDYMSNASSIQEFHNRTILHILRIIVKAKS